jgi:hypothetical protein
VFPVRTEDDSEYNHIVATSKSNQNALAGLYREVMAELKLKPGRLPIVQFNSTELSRNVPPKNGTGRATTQTWDAMTYEVVGWVKTEAHDKLNQNVDMGEDSGEDIDPGEGKVTARTAKKAPVAAETKKAPKAIAAPAAKTAPAGKAKKKVADL